MIADITHTSESKVSGVMDLHIAVFDADANQSQNLVGLIGKLGLTWYGPPGHLVPTVVKRSAYPDQGIDDLDVFVLSGADSLVSHVPDVLFIASKLGGVDDAIRVVSGFLSDGYTTQVILIVPSDVSLTHGHAARHVGFLVRPISLDKLELALNRAVLTLFLARCQQRFDRPLCLRSTGATFYVPVSDIRYVESRARTLHIHLRSHPKAMRRDDVSDGMASASGISDEMIPVTMSLTKFQTFVPDTFIRCHNSFLVNLSFVFRLSRDTITLRDGTCIPVSERKRQHVQQQLCRYGRVVA